MLVHKSLEGRMVSFIKSISKVFDKVVVPICVRRKYTEEQ
jgi:predicted Mrr-cat superfamily restriction endonuclease